MIKSHQKKIKLGTANNQTKWAPFWVIVRKFGQGKRIHPSSVTAHRRNWRTRKLKVRPRISRKSLG